MGDILALKSLYPFVETRLRLLIIVATWSQSLGVERLAEKKLLGPRKKREGRKGGCSFLA